MAGETAGETAGRDGERDGERPRARPESGPGAGAAPTARLMAVTDATWPAAEILERAGWRLRRGGGGGKRVSSATPLCPDSVPDLAPMAAQMRAWGQPPLVRVGADQTALDAALAAAGYAVHDPVLFYEGAVAALGDERDETARVIRVAGDIALTREIWAEGGLDPGRVAVMHRTQAVRTILLVRHGDIPAATAFVATAGETAMIHAIAVRPAFRRRGLGTEILRGAANWARDWGARSLALAVSEANLPATRLYERLGMGVVGRYHYRLGT